MNRASVSCVGPVNHAPANAAFSASTSATAAHATLVAAIDPVGVNEMSVAGCSLGPAAAGEGCRMTAAPARAAADFPCH